MTGRLVVVGVGPGDPALLTERARTVLARAGVVAAVHRAGRPARALKLAAPHLAEGADRLLFAWHHGWSTEERARFYDGIAAALGSRVEAGEEVALLALGDPLFYAAAARVAERLRGRCPIELVPGISAWQAAAAEAGIHLALGDDVVVVVPATLPDARIEAALRLADVAVVVKLGRHGARLLRLLARLGLVERAFFAAELGGAERRLVPLAPGDAPALDEIPYMSLVVVRPGRGA